jgi:hypothetical protein
VFHFRYVYAVAILVGANPLDPDDAFFKVHGGNQLVGIAFDIENNAYRHFGSNVVSR